MRKRIAMLVLIYIIPPILFTLVFIKSITLEKTVPVVELGLVGISKDFPSDISNRTSAPDQRYEIKYDNQINTQLDNFSRFGQLLLKIQPDVIRHTLYLKHNIAATIPYTRYPESDGEKIKTFFFELSCDGKIVKSNNIDIIKQNLKLNDTSGADRTYLESIIKMCMYGTQPIASQNTLGYPISINLDKMKFLPNPETTLIVVPDCISEALIFIGWFISWTGFMILLREGPGKLFSKLKI